ncbi:MAG: hypothetical protein H6R15_2390 [Proteobacteria bacterium]|nr:hypothetical protein [Pseudomonadota bacterium]
MFYFNGMAPALGPLGGGRRGAGNLALRLGEWNAIKWFLAVSQGALLRRNS